MGQKPAGKITVRDAGVLAKIERAQSAVRAARPKDRASRENITLQILDAALDDPAFLRRVLGVRVARQSAA